eukprot:EC784310.1.p1 GENE.EC784310.1~~EC784310.1.p1  ORF type:complete len:73 (+),score=5.96 EC784310.1:74-292(+)
MSETMVAMTALDTIKHVVALRTQLEKSKYDRVAIKTLLINRLAATMRGTDKATSLVRVVDSIDAGGSVEDLA